MDQDSPEQLGEERRRKVRKKRRVTTVTVGGKEMRGDFLKNPSSLEFPDPGARMRKWIVLAIILVGVAISAAFFLKISDWVPQETGAPALQK